MALPAVLLKAKGLVKKGAKAYNAAKQAKNLTSDGEELQASLFNKLKFPLLIGGAVTILVLMFLTIVVSIPFVLASALFGGGNTSNSNENYSGDLAYIQWAIDIANDDSHGYSQCSRTGNPDYDCSSLVWYSLLETGFDETILGSYPFATGSMMTILPQLGFKEYPYKGTDDLKPGDILHIHQTCANCPQHTEIYVGDGKTVGAHGPEGRGVCGVAGDQYGTEISVVENSGNWDRYYRYEG